MLDDILNVYCFFNTDLGYVQGMNELASPIVYVMKNESEAFWCFKELMDVMVRIEGTLLTMQIGK
jgi:hypothetical protein